MKTNRKNFNLYGPQNSWDTNYHLLDNKKEIEYLIDIDDISDDENDENGGLYIKTLLNLEDIDEILNYVWKKKTYISDTHSNLLNLVNKISSNTVLSDSTSSQECYKSGEPCKYNCSGLCKESC